MTYEQLVNNMKNPLDDMNVIKGIVSCYSKNMYNGLINYNRCRKPLGYNKKVRDQLEIDLYNEWITKISNMTDNDIKQLNRRHSSIKKVNLKGLREYVQKIGKVKSQSEIDDYFKDDSKIDKEIFNALELFRPVDLNPFFVGSWMWMKSRVIDGRMRECFNIRHRLYLNIESTHVDLFAKIFAEECRKNNIPYEFKYDDGSRNDSMVIYSDNYHLPKYISILQKIKRNHPEFEGHLYTPPFLTSHIDGWIGYGCEPSIKNKNGGNYSFNSLRAEMFEEVLNKRYKDFKNSNELKNTKFRLKQFNRVVDLKTYIIMSIFAEEYNSIIHNKKYANKNMNGFKESLLKQLTDWVNKNYSKFFSGENVDYLQISFRGENITTLGTYSVNSIMRQAFISRTLNSPEKLKEVQAEIKAKCPEYSIDPNNGALDMKISDKFKEFAVHKKEGVKVTAERQADEIKQMQNVVAVLDEIMDAWSNSDKERYIKATEKFEAVANVFENKKIRMFDFEAATKVEKIRYFTGLLYKMASQGDVASYQEYRQVFDETLNKTL